MDDSYFQDIIIPAFAWLVFAVTLGAFLALVVRTKERSKGTNSASPKHSDYPRAQSAPSLVSLSSQLCSWSSLVTLMEWRSQMPTVNGSSLHTRASWLSILGAGTFRKGAHPVGLSYLAYPLQSATHQPGMARLMKPSRLRGMDLSLRSLWPLFRAG